MRLLVCFLLFIQFGITAQNNVQTEQECPLKKKACDSKEIVNKEEVVCPMKAKKIAIKIEEGEYRGIWNTTSSNGIKFLGYKTTARITKVSETEYKGVLFISSDFTSCCKTPGQVGDGAFTMRIENQKIIFEWFDEIPKCTGVFQGTGTIIEDKIVINEFTGKDCDGDHTGNLEFFK